jgi:uncharacterized membrane protein
MNRKTILVIAVLLILIGTNIVTAVDIVPQNEPTAAELAGQSHNIGFTKVTVTAPDGTIRHIYEGDEL